MSMLDQYAPIVSQATVDELKLLAHHLEGKRIVTVNSTAVGGGVLRDVLARQTPELFNPETALYAVPSVIGAIIVAITYHTAWPAPAAQVAAAVFIFVFRILALWRGWHAPRARRFRGSGNRHR